MEDSIECLPRDGRVVFDWRPDDEYDRVTAHDELAERYVVFEDHRALNGIILFGFFNGKWSANPSGRAVIRDLLRRLQKA